MRPSHVLLSALMLPALAGVTSPAYAGPPPSFVLTDQKASDRADELVRRGLALGNKDRYAEAEPLLRDAWGLKHAYDIAANLGIVEAHLGKWRDAAEHLKLALSTFPANGKAEHKRLVEVTLAAALARVAALTIDVTPAKAEVFVDGKSVGAAPLAEVIFVDPGAHRVEAKLLGHDDAAASVQAVKGGVQTVTLKLTPTPPPPLPPEPPAQPERRSVVPGAVLAGVAGAALVTGIGLVAAGAKKLSSAKDLNQQITQAHHSCVAGAMSFDPQCPTLQSTSSASDTFDRVGVGLLVGAGVLAAGSVVYFLLPQPKPGAPKATGVHLVPSVSTTGGGVLLSGAF